MAEKNEKIVPKCLQMCPQSECSLRKSRKMVHILETDSHTNQSEGKSEKMIKTYCRSAAGQTLIKSELLRPPSVLKDTINYIFKVVIHDKRVPKSVLYDFINDRLRSVKQDAVIQRLEPEHWFEILIPMIRFYAFSAYWLCDESLTKFDQKLNRNQLVDCLLHFITNYEINSNSEYKELYAEVEALFLIINFDVETINRAVCLNLPQTIFQKTRSLILNLYNKNYVTVFRKLSELPLILYCLFTAIHLSKIRKDILKVMSVAYSSKNVYFPLSKLTIDLIYNSDEETIGDCILYGISLTNENSMVKFEKHNTLKNENAPPKKIKILDEKLKPISISNLILKDTIFEKLHSSTE